MNGNKNKKYSKNKKSEYENPRSITMTAENPSRWPRAFTCKFPGIGFPDRLRIRVKYNQVVNFAGAASPAAQVWALNSIAHVDNTGAGGQPSYYNALGTIYKRYCVEGAQAMVEVVNGVTTAGSALQWACQASDFLSAGKSVGLMTEQKYTVHGLTPTSSTTGGVLTDHQHFPYLSMPELQGQPSVEVDPSNYAAIANDPTDLVYLVFRAINITGANAVGSVKITILQDVIFKELVDGSQ